MNNLFSEEFGNDTGLNDTTGQNAETAESNPRLILYYPPKTILDIKANILNNKSTKQSLESRYSGKISTLRKLNVAIEIRPLDEKFKYTAKDMNYAYSLLSSFLESYYNKNKLEWAKFITLMEFDPRNTYGLLNIITGNKADKMLETLAQKHCLTMNEAWKELGQTSELQFSRYLYYNYWGDFPKEWQNSPITSAIGNMVAYVCGPDFKKNGDNDFYSTNNTIFLLPSSELERWYLNKKHGGKSPELSPGDDIKDKKLQLFISSDLISQMPIYSGMKISGVIKAGVTKVPASVSKKIASLMQLQELPELKRIISDRCSILAFLGAYADVAASDLKDSQNDNLKVATTFITALNDVIEKADDKLVRLLIAPSVGKLSKYGINDLRIGVIHMIEFIYSMLKKMPVQADDTAIGAWVDFDNVIDWILYEEASSSYDINWVYSHYYYQISLDEALSYPDYYERIKLPVIYGLIQILAAIGMLDIAYDSKGQYARIRYIRITNAGLWDCGRVKELKIELKKVEDGLHFDPESLMITIRDTNSPNFALLNDLTEKVTPNRYKITDTALLKGCKTVKELKARVDRLKDYLLAGQKSTQLTILIDRLYTRINKVKTTTGDGYICMDVDPTDKNLHQLIMNNPQIRKNTLRVEGWKLLVKRSFYPTFLEKLRQGGYLTESYSQ